MTTLRDDIRESQSGFRVTARYPDRVIVEDEDLAEYLGEDINPGDERVLSPWVSLTDLHTLRAKLASWQWSDTCPMPDWLDLVLDESEWAAKNHFNGEAVAWLAGGTRAIIQAPYTLTLSDALDKQLSSPYRFSPLLRGWVVSRVDTDAEDLSGLLKTYDITLSPALSDRIEGRGGWREQLESTVERAKMAGFKVPSGFKSGRVLKEHQAMGVLALASQGSTLLADQVGLGKGGEFTCGLLSLNDWLASQDKQLAYPAVFSVTKSMKDEIVEEVLRWKDDAKIEVLYGTKSAEIDPNAEFVILNHDILSKRLPDILEVRPRAFVADEAHVFKNEDAVRTQAALELAEAVRENNPDNAYTVMASGTPFLSSPVELWSLLGILGLQDFFAQYAMKKIGPEATVRIRTTNGIRNVKLSPKRAFEVRWCNGHSDSYGAWYNNGSSNTSELNRLLVQTGMVRRRKSDVMHPLPELKERLTSIELGDEQMEEYLRVEDEFRSWAVEEARRIALDEDLDEDDAARIMLRKLENGEGMMRLTALRKTLAYFKVDGTVDWIHRFMSGEMEFANEDGSVERVGDDPKRRKLIVFVHHQEPRQMLVDHPELQQYGVVTILSGAEQDGDSIQEHKRLFQEDNDDHRLIICSMAAREGHTLTAAKDVYLMEIPFVPSWIVQMAGRCWARISEAYEPHEATVHYSVVMGTEDARSMKRVRLKKSIFEAVIDNEGSDETISDVKAEDVETLLEDLGCGKRILSVAR